MNQQRLLEQWKREEQASFSGWDFSHVASRIQDGELPWDYDALAKELLLTAKSVLDMGTGGGERLASLAPLPTHTVAVEAYQPNVPIAKKKLEPLRVEVVGVKDMQALPLDDKMFDLIINHHTEYSSVDVYRLLQSNGIFLTQQVGGQNLQDLTEFFGQQVPWPEHTLDRAKSEAQKAGLTVLDAQEWHGTIKITDVGALVYFLKAIPWVVQDFSVTRCQKYLFNLQERLEKDGQLIFGEHRFLFQTKKS